MSVDSLVDRIEALRAMRDGRRIVIAIAGSPGGGKTTLARTVVDAVNQRRPDSAAHLPMDGFHLANATLDRLSIHDRKGAIDTFDAWGFVALLRRLRVEHGHTVYAPSFERRIDEGVAGDIAIEDSHDVVIVEGNYVLSNEQPWSDVRGLVDETWFCVTPAAIRVDRLVERHMTFGRNESDARAWARDVDGANAALIEKTALNADVLVSGETGAMISAPAR